MKRILFIIALLGCGCSSSSQTTIVKTGFDKYTLAGNDPVRLRGDAYVACQKDGYVDYSIIDTEVAGKTGREVITVRCEKEPKSFFSETSDKASEVWDGIKKKFHEMTTEDEKKKP